MPLPPYDESLGRKLYDAVSGVFADTEQPATPEPTPTPQPDSAELIAPKNLRVYDITGSSMKAEWDAVQGAEAYDVDWTAGQSKTVTSTSTSIGYLMPENDYPVRVRAVRGAEVGPEAVQRVRTPKSGESAPDQTPSPAPTPDPTPRPTPAPGNGRTIHIGGINIAGAEFKPNNYWPTEPDFILAASKGVRQIRLPFLWEDVQPQLNGPVNTDNLMKCANWAEKHSQQLILDMHNYMKRGGKLIGSNDLPQSAYNDVWVKIAKVFKDHPAVFGYGLMNEPNGTGGTWHKVASSVIEAIRTVDRDTFRFIAGDGWGNARNFPELNKNFPLDDPDDRNVYEAHSYDNSSHSGVWEDRSEVVPVDRGVSRLKPFVDWLKKHGLRGYIGEIGGFGTSRANNETMLTGEPAKAATESAKRATQYLADNGVPFAWWAMGSHWGTSNNGLQTGGRGANRDYRDPFNAVIAPHVGRSVEF